MTFRSISGAGSDVNGVGSRAVRVFSPTAHPLRELAAHLADLCGLGAGEVAGMLELDPARAADLALTATRRHTRLGALSRVPVLVIDQFEELFTLADGADGGAQRDRFTRALQALAAPPAVGARRAAAVVVVAVRADFLDRAVEIPAVSEAAASAFILEPLTRAELREAVRAPADAVGVPVESRLVEAVLQDAYGPSGGPPPGVGVLPLVSQAMAATWRLRRGRTLTLRAYRRAGGLAEAVDHSAHRAYKSLDAPGRMAVRTMFLLLTRVTVDGRAVRRTATRAELYSAAGLSRAAGDAVVEAFAGERLLVLDGESVEICHDVLLDAWRRLRGWLEGDVEARGRYGELLADADAWHTALRRRSDHLYRSLQLEAVAGVESRWRADDARYPLPAHTLEFLAASHRAVRRTRRARTVVTAALTVLAFAASTAAVIALANARHARALQAVALSRQLAAESLSVDTSDPLTARQLAAAAWAVAPTGEAAAAMTTLLTEQQTGSILIGHAGSVSSVAFNRSGTLLASAGFDGTVRLWNPATEQEVGQPIIAGTGESNSVFGVAFSPSGTLLATAEEDGTVKLWNPASEREVGVPIAADTSSHGNGAVFGVAFNPSGTLLATADGDGTVKLWDPANGREVGQPIVAVTAAADSVDPIPVVNAVAFNPSGTLLATAGTDGPVKLWDPVTERQVGQLITNDGSTGALTVAFNPSGTVMATVNGNGTVRLWDSVTERQVGQLITNGENLNLSALVFNPSGSLLASADIYGTVKLWDPANGREIGQPIAADTSGKNSGVLAVAFNPSGTILATADGDGTVKLWSPATDRAAGAAAFAGPPTVQAVGVNGVAFNRSGTLLATADEDGTVRQWDPSTGQEVGDPIAADTAGKNAGVVAVAFNPSGTILATADGDGTVKLWNPANGREIGQPITADNAAKAAANNATHIIGWNPGVNSVTFNPSGTLLATGDGDGTVKLWNPANGREVGQPITADNAGQDDVHSVAFNPSGTLLATGDTDGTVKLWNPANGREVGQPFTADNAGEGGVYSVAFNPSGTLLATGDGHGEVELWEPATGREVGQPIAADTPDNVDFQDPGVNSVAFNPSGTLLASANGDGFVKLWNPATGQEMGDAVTASSNGAGSSGVAFNPSGTVLASVSEDGILQRWFTAYVATPYETLCSEAGGPNASTWKIYSADESEPTVCQ